MIWKTEIIRKDKHFLLTVKKGGDVVTTHTVYSLNGADERRVLGEVLGDMLVKVGENPEEIKGLIVDDWNSAGMGNEGD